MFFVAVGFHSLVVVIFRLVVHAESEDSPTWPFDHAPGVSKTRGSFGPQKEAVKNGNLLQ